MTIEIWHNPRCSKSRETLKLLEENGISPTIYLYLQENPDEKSISQIIKKLEITPRDLLRTSEESYKAQNLKNPDLKDIELIQAMAKEPKLIQRPIVINGNKARLGRPPEQVLDIV